MILLLPRIRTTKTVVPKWLCLACRNYAAPTASGSRQILPEAQPAAKLRKSIGPARTRFAPSPTGYLHLGSLRTALFSYLIAKATQGQFILRIEDTDQKRTVVDSEEKLYKDLEWAGIEWDEGPKIGGPYGPYKQSERTAIYREHAQRLLDEGHAYRCFCSQKRLNAFAEHRKNLGLPPDYDRTCAHIRKEASDDRAAKGEAHVVRLLVPAVYPKFNDLVYGLVRQKNETKKNQTSNSFDDPILMKSDGFPTYHLANVVDDHLMKITHVIRGSEWMSSTPKHLVMYQAFGWTPPSFAHVGLLLDTNRQKLSKRAASTNIYDLRKQGIFPEALNNFAALLGWSHGTGNDVMDMKELIANASLKYTRGDSVVTPEKLWFLQKRHAAKYATIPPGTAENPSKDLMKLVVEPTLRIVGVAATEQPEQYSYYLSMDKVARRKFIQDLVYADAISFNYRTPSDLITRNKHFFVAPTTEELTQTIAKFNLHGVPKGVSPQITPKKVVLAFSTFSNIPSEEWGTNSLRDWTNSIISQSTAESLSELDPTMNQSEVEPLIKRAWGGFIHRYVRWAVMAGMPGPDGAEIMRILGKDEIVRRFSVAGKVVMSTKDEGESESIDG